MGYYDVYDGNDNLIASEVWIDDGVDCGRPIVINWYKLILTIFFLIGVISTFITPINLFIHRDSFTNNGWIYMSVFNILLGLPTFIAFFTMLKIIKKPDPDDSAYTAACQLANDFTDKGSSHLYDDEISDEEFVSAKKQDNKNKAIIASIYVAIKYQKLLYTLSKFSYLIYPLVVLSIIMELFFVNEDAYFIVLLNANYVSMICAFLSTYKCFKMYQKNGLEVVRGRLLKTIACSFIFSVPVAAIIISLTKTSSFYILVYLVAFMDLTLILDNFVLKKKGIKESNGEKNAIHLGAILVVTVCVGLVMLAIATGACIFPGPLYDAIIAYDEGLSTDLTLPIIFWSICLVVDIVLTILISSFLNKKLNNKKGIKMEEKC